MIFHDVLAQMLYEEQKRKLDFITLKGWQFYREEHKQADKPIPKKTTIQVHKCSTC
jgi:hypothetical protein